MSALRLGRIREQSEFLLLKQGVRFCDVEERPLFHE